MLRDRWGLLGPPDDACDVAGTILAIVGTMADRAVVRQYSPCGWAVGRWIATLGVTLP